MSENISMHGISSMDLACGREKRDDCAQGEDCREEGDDEGLGEGVNS